MFKIFTLVAVLVPGTLFADNLTPEQTGVINNTDPTEAEVFPTAVNNQITDVVDDDDDMLDAGTDCAGTEEDGADDGGCASDSQEAVAVGD